MGFTKEQLQDYNSYERVRKSGRYNMYSAEARMATGLTKEEYIFVMRNYTELKAEFINI